MMLIRHLVANGLEVWKLDTPGALMVRFSCLKHRQLCWEPLSVSNLLNYPPVFRETKAVTTVEEALASLNLRHSIGRV